MDKRLISQSFLGEKSDQIMANVRLGIVGVGGGGSHIAQQAAHVGIGGFTLADHDRAEIKNLNRLVGATLKDAKGERHKVTIAKRLILGINPNASVIARPVRWQEAIEDLRMCDAIVGCVDSYVERDGLERFCRRHLIPYIDLGMDVHGDTQTDFSIGGQVVLSSTGGPCLWCLGLLTDQRLAQEAAGYGDAGSRPQVVWVNGVLASVAIGLLIQMLCPWHRRPVLSACCEFDGNGHRIETNRMDAWGGNKCQHHTADALGDLLFASAEPKTHHDVGSAPPLLPATSGLR